MKKYFQHYIVILWYYIEESSDPQQETQSRRESIEDSRLWNAKRDEICQTMWSDYTMSGE